MMKSEVTEIAHASGTTDAVDVLFDVGREVEVDDVLDMRDVETARSDGRGHQNGRLARAEPLEGVLALALAAVAVNRRHRVPVAVEELFQRVGAALRLDEHQRELFRSRRRNVSCFFFVNRLGLFHTAFQPTKNYKKLTSGTYMIICQT